MIRTPSCVFGCRCSTKPPQDEWICEKHWKTVPRSVKARFNATKRLIRRMLRRNPLYAEWWKFPPGSSRRFAGIALWKRHERAWSACKEAANDAAVGL